MAPRLLLATCAVGLAGAFVPVGRVARRARMRMVAEEALDDYRKNAMRISNMETEEERTMRVVMKFGGSSLANAERIDHVCQLVKSQIALGYRPILVCSAMGKTTNNLLTAGDFALQGRVAMDAVRTLHDATADIIQATNGTRAEVTALMDELERFLTGVSYLRELTPRAMDQLVSFGERSSVRLVAAKLNRLGVPAQCFDSFDMGMVTTGEFGNAEVLPETYERMGKALRGLDENVVPVVTGFIGKDKEGRITTLGRGGSDLTASVIAKAADLDEIQVWKDVDGIMSADPRSVPGAVPVTEVTYEEAAELAYFGAKVLHPISMMPAMDANIPVRVKNSYNPTHPGTVIRRSRDMRDSLCTAITTKRNVQVIDVVSTRMLGQYGFLSNVFEAFERNKLSVDVVATSEVSVSLTLDDSQQVAVERVVDELGAIAQVSLKKGKAILSLVANIHRSSEVLGIIFSVLSTEGIAVDMLSQGASKVNISLVLNSDDLERATRALHKCFFEEKVVPGISQHVFECQDPQTECYEPAM